MCGPARRTLQPSRSYTFLRVPTRSYTFLHVPARSYTFLHVPTRSYAFLHVPTRSYTFLHVPRMTRHSAPHLQQAASKQEGKQSELEDLQTKPLGCSARCRLEGSWHGRFAGSEAAGKSLGLGLG